MRLLLTPLLVLAAATVATAQPSIDALRVFLGATGSTCVLRSGTGAPATSLGAVCDVYVRKDSPYGVYVKSGASTWSEFYRAGGNDVAVADGGTGQSSWTTGHLVYATGATTLAGTATPSVTSLTAASAVSSPTFTGAGAVNLTAGGSSNLTLNPPGDVVFNPTGNDLLPTTGYDLNIGALTNKFLTLHVAELWAETLVAQNTIATIGGRILVGPTTTLTSDLAAAATTMVVKHNQMSTGDRVVLQVNNQVEWITINSSASGSGPYTYTIVRNQDGSGANDWAAGDAVFNTGTTGNGYIDLYSVAGLLPGSTAGPTIVGNQRLSNTYNDIAPRWAIGNLNGLYGYGVTTYGAAFGDATAANVTIDATDGIRFRNSTTTTLGITGSTIDLLNTGVLKSGSASALGTGSGVWLAANSGTPQFRVGDPAGNRVSWDGTNLTLVSANATIDSSGVRIAPSTSTTFSDLRAYSFTTAGGAMGFYGFDASGVGRHATVRNDYTGVSNYGGILYSSIGSQHSASGGGGFSGSALVAAISDPANNEALVRIGASSYTEFSTDFRLYHNNGSTAAMPYYRSDGNYGVFNSRSSANGGALWFNNDVSADVNLAAGGGSTNIWSPNFTTRPRWGSGLAQLTVGAAGGASALPATPSAYLLVNFNGTNLVIPAYAP